MTPRHDPPPPDDDIVDLAVPGVDPTHGPFRPPSGYEFEPELRGPAPRDVPADLGLGRGRLGRHRFRSSWGALFAGVIATAGGLAPLALPTGSLLLPLVLLIGLGGLLLLLGVVGLVRNVVARGPYRYVVEGLPIVVRAVAVGRRTVWTDRAYRTEVYDVDLQYRDPRTGELREARATSDPFPVSVVAVAPGVTYRAGDYATAVSLPDDPEGSPRLYGFLGLRDGLGLVARGPFADPGPVASLAMLAGWGLALDLLFWAIYSLFRYAPAGIAAGTVALLIVAGALLGGLGVAAFLALRPEPDESDGPREGVGTGILLIGLVAVGLGGMIATGGAFAANVVLDPGPSAEEPVVVDKVRQANHRLGLRTYELRFHFERGDAAPHDFAATADHLARFPNPPAPGRAVVRGGRFGWRWVEDIRPIAGP